MRAVKHRHMADLRDEKTGCFSGNVRREIVLPLLERREFYFDQLVRSQRLIHAFQERPGHAFLADAQDGVQALRERLQLSDLRIGKGFVAHGLRSCRMRSPRVMRLLRTSAPMVSHARKLELPW